MGRHRQGHIAGGPRPAATRAQTRCRGLVITGGHDHETAFYTLFDGYKDLAWMPVASSATAFPERPARQV